MEGIEFAIDGGFIGEVGGDLEVDFFIRNEVKNESNICTNNFNCIFRDAFSSWWYCVFSFLG